MLVIGSVAMMHHDLFRPNKRQVQDIDLIAFPEEAKVFSDCEVVKEKPHKTVYKGSQGMYFEVEWAYSDTNQIELMELLGLSADYEFHYAPKGVLYALKMSHRFLKNSPHFLKTMQDIHIMRKEWGFKEIPKFYLDWYLRRFEDTYDYTHPKLNQSKEGFFNENVFDGKRVYVYDHDSLHEAVKIYEKPAYSYFTDGEVKVSRSMFMELPYKIKLASVVEESCVLALERAMIPHNTHQDRAFSIALEKVCTSIASGWWRDFAWENYRQALRMFKDCEFDLKKDLQLGLDSGIVKPFKK